MKYTMDEIHAIDLKLAKEFVKICKKYNLNYYIIGGTFLGAVRHKGFIPWDDDMDIAMPRNDYEKFLEVANKELPTNMRLDTFYNNEKHRYFLPRLVDLDTEITEKRFEKVGIKSHLFIDIFPIDGTPNNKILRKIHYFKILFYRMLVSMYYIDTIDPVRKRKTYEKILITIGKIIPVKWFVNPKKTLIKIDNILKKQKIENSNNIGTIMGAYRTREIVPKEYFGKPTKYQFEDINMTGPEKFDEYLTHMYGDYMTPPKNNNNEHYSK